MNEKRINNIRQLLDKYYRGETSDSEEDILRHYFANEDVDSQLEPDKEMFLQLLSAASNLPIPEGLESRLSTAIDTRAASEKQTIANRKKIRPLSWRSIASIAASLAVILSLGFYFDKTTTSHQALMESDLTPEETYEQTEKALMIFAEALNKGVDGMTTVVHASHKVRMQVDSSLHFIDRVEIIGQI